MQVSIICLVTVYGFVGDGLSLAQGVIITPGEKKACQDLKGYMDKYKSAILKSRGDERERRITDLKKEYAATLDALPSKSKAEMGNWEKLTTLMIDASSGDPEKREEDQAASFGIIFQACGGALRP